MKKLSHPQFSESTVPEGRELVGGIVRSRGFVIACDENYFPGVAGCVAAIRRYNSAPIAFLDTGVTSKQLAEVTKIVDKVIDLNFIHKIDAATSSHTSHLNKSALSSLYAHQSGYDDIIYIDIDALVLDNLDPLFASLYDADIAGVRGNQLGAHFDDINHTVENELTKKGVEFVKRIFPPFNPSGLAINSGCFAVRAELLIGWEDTISLLLRELTEFKLVDQSLINVMIQLSACQIQLVDWSYNLMGLQFVEESRDKYELTMYVDEKKCEIYFGNQKVRVAHFSGRRKPWMVVDTSVGSIAWRWHNAPSELARKTLSFRNYERQRFGGAPRMSVSEDELGRYNARERLRIAFSLIEIGNIAAAKAWIEDLFLSHTDELVVQRVRALIESYEGKAYAAFVRFNAILEIAPSDQNALSRRRREQLGSAFGSNRINVTPDHSHILEGVYRDIDDRKLDLAGSTLQSLPIPFRQSAETVMAATHLLQARGVSIDPKHVILGLYDNALLRQSVQKNENNRANLLFDAIVKSSAIVLSGGCSVLQIGSGTGVLLETICLALQANVFAIDPLALNESPLCKKLSVFDHDPEFYSGEKKFSCIVINDVLGRSSDPVEVLTACQALLTEGGVIVVSEPSSREFRLEGLVTNPVRREICGQIISDIILSLKQDLAETYLLGTDAVYIIKAASPGPGMMADRAASVLLGLVRGSCRDHANGVSVNALAEVWLARAWLDCKWLTSTKPIAKLSVFSDLDDGANARWPFTKMFGHALVRKLGDPREVGNVGPSVTEQTKNQNASVETALINLEDTELDSKSVDKLLETLPRESHLVTLGFAAARARNVSDDHIHALINRSSYFGAVTINSARFARSIVAPEVSYRVQYFPPITFAREVLTSHIRGRRGSGQKNVVGFNISSVMLKQIYGAETRNVVGRIFQLVRILQSSGKEVRYLSHSNDDLLIGLAMTQSCPGVSVIALEGRSLPTVHHAYRMLDCYVGLRAEPLCWAMSLGVPTRAFDGDLLVKEIFSDISRTDWLLGLEEVEFFAKASSVIDASLKPDDEARDDFRAKLLSQINVGMEVIGSIR